MQLNLSFLEDSGSSHELWESLDRPQQQTVTDELSRLIAKAALGVEGHVQDGEDNDE
jgi:hypothetical protein